MKQRMMNKSMSFLLRYINKLPQEDRIHLFEMIGMDADDDLSMVVGTTDPVNGEQLSQFPEFRIHKFLNLYIPPILFVFGTVGNILTFAMMRYKSISYLYPYIFLSALALVDSMVHVSGLLLQWVGDLTGYEITDQSNFLCKFILILGYVSSDISVWLLVALMVEHYTMLHYRVQGSILSNHSRVKKVIGMLVVLFVINIHFVWTVELKETTITDQFETKCDVRSSSRYFIMTVWPWIDATLCCFVPFMILSVLNVLIIKKVMAAKHDRKAHHNISAMISSTYFGYTVRAPGCSWNTDVSLSRTLLTVSFTFLLTTLPMSIFIVATPTYYQHDLFSMSRIRLLLTIAELCMYLNHSINFFLYCGTWRNFRYHVLCLMCRKLPVRDDVSEENRGLCKSHLSSVRFSEDLGFSIETEL